MRPITAALPSPPEGREPLHENLRHARLQEHKRKRRHRHCSMRECVPRKSEITHHRKLISARVELVRTFGEQIRTRHLYARPSPATC
eukprot:1822839-Pleurochrysis_carterae.AAC.2